MAKLSGMHEATWWHGLAVAIEGAKRLRVHLAGGLLAGWAVSLLSTVLPLETAPSDSSTGTYVTVMTGAIAIMGLAVVPNVKELLGLVGLLNHK